MTENNPMTVGDVRKAIKDIPDDIPVYLESEDQYMELLSIHKKTLNLGLEDYVDEDTVLCLCLDYT